ncbi:MAG: GrpB family protein [Chloroflexi bacterium]|nr:GrpB family protein [Chloroflexota bacterium]
MTLEIHTYDPEWPNLFQQTAESIRIALGDLALRIDHIGSTAIPGAAAKPIIDIQVSVVSFQPFEPIVSAMDSIGFIWRSDNPDLSKRYFRESPGKRRTHIHMRCTGSWSEQMALLFRDYMRCHAEDVQQYVELKQQLAEQFRHDRSAYTKGKSPFIWKMMAKAECSATNR